LNTPSGLYWERRGDPAGPSLILSAGLGGMASYWRPNLDILTTRFNVHLYDQRGTGQSVRALGDVVTADDLAADIEDVMDAAGLERAIVIGHAAGAVAGLALGLRAPHRLAGLVSVNGWARTDPHFRRCIEMRLAVLAAGGPRAFLRAQPVFLYPPAWVSRNDAQLDAQLPEQLADFQGERALRARAGALLAFDVSERLGEIAAPCLIVAAQDDFLVPSLCSEALAQALPQAELAIMAAGGHACNITHAEAYDRIVIDWLSRTFLRGE
jgi:aminoacrylate hydrolase